MDWTSTVHRGSETGSNYPEGAKDDVRQMISFMKLSVDGACDLPQTQEVQKSFEVPRSHVIAGAGKFVRVPQVQSFHGIESQEKDLK